MSDDTTSLRQQISALTIKYLSKFTIIYTQKTFREPHWSNTDRPTNAWTWYQYLIQADTNMHNDPFLTTWGRKNIILNSVCFIKYHLCDSQMKLNVKNQDPKGAGPPSEIKPNYFRKVNIVSTNIINNHHFMNHHRPSIDRPSSIHQIKTLAIPPPARQLRQCAWAWTGPWLRSHTGTSSSPPAKSPPGGN